MGSIKKNYFKFFQIQREPYSYHICYQESALELSGKKFSSQNKFSFEKKMEEELKSFNPFLYTTEDVVAKLKSIPGGRLRTAAILVGFLLPLVISEVIDLFTRTNLQITECSVNSGSYNLSNCFEYGVVKCLDGKIGFLVNFI